MLKNVKIAFESIFANKFRAILTTLGILFGVAAVIAMLAIGSGAQQKILEQLEIVGVNNVIIHSVYEEEIESETEEDNTTSKKYSPGLNLKDHENILTVLPNIKNISSEVGFDCFAYSAQLRKKTKAIGVHNSYFQIFNLRLEQGSFFNSYHNEERKAVCVLGSKLAKQLFPKSSPLNNMIRIGGLNLRVIGILKDLSGINEDLESMGINNYNNELYLPINTMVMRYKNRGKVELFDDWGDEKGSKNINQLDKIVVQLDASGSVEPTAKVIARLLHRRHNEVEDFKVTVPEQILNQQKETDDIFNWLLGAIASISLLVGGIGIMNIMLASVMERIREIGLRKSIGAQTIDIKFQFIFEALFISLSGGIAGVIIGIGLSYAIELFLDMPTKISFFSIVLSFFISVLTGVVFGYIPAKKAAEQSPVNSLKYE